MGPHHKIPVVIAVSGADPTGGAGIQADIEALVSMGCHTAPVITALTVQDTQRFMGFEPVSPMVLIQQIRAVLEDMEVAAVKLGMLGSVGVVEAVHTILKDYPRLPVVLDPVLRSGSGGELATDEVRDALVELLLPLTTVLTPNSLEARALAPEADSLEACAHALAGRGAEFVLVTGTHEATPGVVNTLYGNGRLIDSYGWERLPGTYHGSGCTLAAAIAGLLAHGAEPMHAVREAQEYTWETLKQGYRIGMGQHIPNRLFWAGSERGPAR
ncbi:MAG: hydroxymethylpyrimidine/phosphomethylpyrimidine kinase [Gammaproteobacteria bacterium]|nr:hydroxymethylpyrimidine/phosphomethylpyrimidine kinase [Gammaproteobacteria bacterium]